MRCPSLACANCKPGQCLTSSLGNAGGAVQVHGRVPEDDGARGGGRGRAEAGHAVSRPATGAGEELKFSEKIDVDPAGCTLSLPGAVEPLGIFCLKHIVGRLCKHHLHCYYIEISSSNQTSTPHTRATPPHTSHPPYSGHVAHVCTALPHHSTQQHCTYQTHKHHRPFRLTLTLRRAI